MVTDTVETPARAKAHAAKRRTAPAPPLALAPPELLVDVELDEAGAAAEVVLLLLLEEPQAATPTARAATLRARAEILGT